MKWKENIQKVSLQKILPNRKIFSKFEVDETGAGFIDVLFQDFRACHARVGNWRARRVVDDFLLNLVLIRPGDITRIYNLFIQLFKSTIILM